MLFYKKEYEYKYPPKIVVLHYRNKENFCMQFNLNERIKKILLLFIAGAIYCTVVAQENKSTQDYRLIIQFIDKDSSFPFAQLKLANTFNNQEHLWDYIQKLPALLAAKGYPTSSVDSVSRNNLETTIKLYLGLKYHFAKLNYSTLDKNEKNVVDLLQQKDKNKGMPFFKIAAIEQALLTYHENNGYPFATVFLDSVSIEKDLINASLKVNKGVFYKIDSIIIRGKAKLNNGFLQRHLSIHNNSPYDKEKLFQVDKKINELPYLKVLQPSDITLLGTGAILNLYLQKKKSSQFNFLLGLQPASSNNNKLQLTGDLNLDLKNLFASGENILLKWQQLQPQSPRLQIGFSKPYIFKSPFGIDMLFELFKKDSTFLQVNAQLGVQFSISNYQSGRIFMQWQNSSLLSGAIDTLRVKSEKRLPSNIDVNSTNLGLTYEWNNTNYKINPKNGNELNLTSMIGIKTLKPNNEILAIKDNAFNYAGLYDSLKFKTYNICIKLSAAHYFSIGKSSTVKAAVQTGTILSPDIFRNELFQLGGYKVMRGFDEESIYATQYGVFTAEYRLLFSTNSYLSFFTDWGVTKNKYQTIDVSNRFFGAGIGLLFETKSGVFNLNYAIGKRDDVRFNLREASKIHFGYVNYF